MEIFPKDSLSAPEGKGGEDEEKGKNKGIRERDISNNGQ